MLLAGLEPGDWAPSPLGLLLCGSLNPHPPAFPASGLSWVRPGPGEACSMCAWESKGQQEAGVRQDGGGFMCVVGTCRGSWLCPWRELFQCVPGVPTV